MVCGHPHCLLHCSVKLQSPFICSAPSWLCQPSLVPSTSILTKNLLLTKHVCYTWWAWCHLWYTKSYFNPQSRILMKGKLGWNSPSNLEPFWTQKLQQKLIAFVSEKFCVHNSSITNFWFTILTKIVSSINFDSKGKQLCRVCLQTIVWLFFLNISTTPISTPNDVVLILGLRVHNVHNPMGSLCTLRWRGEVGMEGLLFWRRVTSYHCFTPFQTPLTE